ncbi:Two-component response regulator ARR11 [Glycine soja]|uniref:Two-component response regulator ARR11 n=1 Tax=Glycine soja TaxID=3848 RepID=A0A0B2SHS1_GLYSO|nr:Two-component response regulator ARR11 [Glycine soja]
MPTMNGYEFLHRASKEIDVPVIVMSLDHNNYTVMRAVQLGACDFWVKPLRYYQFKNMRTHVLRKSLKENKIQTKDCVGSLEDDE